MGSLVAKSEEADNQNFNLPPPTERHRCPGKASDLLAQRKLLEQRGLQEGHSIVVVADIAAPYNLRQEQRGELVKVDEDGDAFIRFYGDEEIWMHRSALHLLAAEPDSLSCSTQLLQLLCSFLVALCLGEVLVAFPAAVSAVAEDGGLMVTNIWPLLASLLALPAFDIAQVRSLLYSFPDVAASFGPALFAASQLPLGPSANLVVLGLALLAFALTALEELHFSFAALCRQRDGWAYLAAVPSLLPLGALKGVPAIALGIAGALSAVVLSCNPPETEVLLRQHRAQASATGQAAAHGSKVWPPAGKANFSDNFAVGLLGGGLLLLHQLFVAALEAPAETCFADPTPWHSRSSWVALWIGIIVVLLPESWRSDYAFSALIALLPLFFMLLLVLPFSEAPGVGDLPFVALCLLVFIFPSMLVLFVQRLSRLARSCRGGAALFLALGLWCAALAIQMAPYGEVPARGHPLQTSALSLLGAASWLLGAAAGPVADEQQVRSFRRPNAFVSAGTFVLTMAAIFFGAGVLSELRADSTVAKTFSSATLVLAELGVAEEVGDAACLTEALRHADLIGLQGGRKAREPIANSLGLLHYSGTPGAVSNREPAVLSSVRLWNVTANWQEAGSRDVASWVAASLQWRGTHVTYIGVWVDDRGDPVSQLNSFAAVLRRYDGPLLVAGHLALPRRKQEPDLRRFLEGSGLQDAFGTTRGHSAGGEFLRDLFEMDYVFYRGLELVEAHDHSSTDCAERMPRTASFQLKSS